MKKNLKERGDDGLIENHPEWAAIVKDEVERAKESVESKYELGGRDIEEVEHKSRDGFSSSNDGGYVWSDFSNISYLMGTGYVSSLPKKAAKAVEDEYDANNKMALEQFKETYAKEIEGIPEDKLNYHDLYELKKGDLAEKLSELESDHNSDDHSTVMFQVRVMFYAGEGDEHSMTVQAAVNWGAPYHRSKDGEDYEEIDFDFKNEAELKKHMKSAMDKCIKFMGGR